MYGGFGDDTYYVDSADDNVFEYVQDWDPDSNQWVSGGTDTVYSSARDFTLPDQVEHLYLEDGAVAGSGNSLDNTIVGNVADNWLRGMSGKDTLIGGEGADRMEGGSGNNTFIIDNGNATGGDVVIGGGEYDIVEADISEGASEAGAISRCKSGPGKA